MDTNKVITILILLSIVGVIFIFNISTTIGDLLDITYSEHPIELKYLGVEIVAFQTLFHNKTIEIEDEALINELLEAIRDVRIRKIEIQSSQYDIHLEPYNTFKISYDIPKFKDIVFYFYGDRFVWITGPYLCGDYKVTDTDSVKRIYEIFMRDQNKEDFVKCEY